MPRVSQSCDLFDARFPKARRQRSTICFWRSRPDPADSRGKTSERISLIHSNRQELAGEKATVTITVTRLPHDCHDPYQQKQPPGGSISGRGGAAKDF